MVAAPNNTTPTKNTRRPSRTRSAATHDDVREAVETLEDAGQIARRVLGDAHPLTEWTEDGLQDAQDALYARGLP